MSTPELLTETEAADRIGWTSAALRSHRHLQDAQVVADQLPTRLARVIRLSRTGPWAATGAVRKQLLGLVLVRAVGQGQQGVELTRLGVNVGLRLRMGTRAVPAPTPEDGPGRIYYRADVVAEWLEQHPEFRDEDKLRAATIDQAKAARVLGISRATMISYMSKRRAAMARMASGREEGDDRSVANRCPPWIKVGFDDRFRLSQIKQWMKRKGRAARG